ncbi:hypothetical protein E2I00_008585, partial [Balaenoptera physalus]
GRGEASTESRPLETSGAPSGAPPAAPGRIPRTVLRASGARDGQTQCIGGPQGPGEGGKEDGDPTGMAKGTLPPSRHPTPCLAHCVPAPLSVIRTVPCEARILPAPHTRVACWEGVLPKHACSPGQPVVAAIGHQCLPACLSPGRSSPLQPPPPPFLPNVPHQEGLPASSWVTLPRPAQRPAPPPTVLASPCGGCSLFGSRMARLLVGAAEQTQCQSPAPMGARNQQLWDPNTRARSGCGIRW